MSRPEPRAVAITDQWRAGLRELVNRVRYHRIGCPDEGAGVVCLGAGTLNDIEAMSCDRVQALLITALYEMAGYPLAQASSARVAVIDAARAHARSLRLVKELNGYLSDTAQRLLTAVDMLDATKEEASDVE